MPARRWILENLVGSASTKRLERDVLEEGRLEVDGGQHEPGALEGDVTDLSFGRRCTILLHQLHRSWHVDA